MRAKVNLSIEPKITEEARELGVNMSRVAEAAISQAIKLERNRRWRAENQAALDVYSEEVAEAGLPLEDSRLF